ncbi:hypothetical protein COEREDRAFT_8674 [Coemansia reversa NRRL 1564]|uniref:Large ribosomal subunit protein uL30-like ferredoxin-like fold domain-containing protein n=1 Tax=Coemansia reversa (strain ATCC 12441 / NRRL 1564) TaxID=763665 RepID=A0A2G5BC30_COERN|nr:hypothetical protein COEREDRAFT_8674 [Coemansia reversa NRRL 1564]|eukprot:PIA16267.1 hypothetical protein COEREDRAFT_8674 [Coemansia reversa NRRL 1564]
MFRSLTNLSKTSIVSNTLLRKVLTNNLRYASTVTNTESTPKKLWKITLKRSTIGLHPQTRENARVLGLKRCGHVVYRPVTNELAGIIIKVKEIIKLELVDRVDPPKTGAPSGFEVIGRLNSRIASGSKAAKPLLPLRAKGGTAIN